MPAELLIKAVDSPIESGYRKGDVVEVRQEGASYGKEECLPKFLIIKATGISFENAKTTYLKPLTQVDPIAGEVMVARRKYRFDIDANLSTADLTEIKNADWLVRSFTKSLIVEKS